MDVNRTNNSYQAPLPQQMPPPEAVEYASAYIPQEVAPPPEPPSPSAELRAERAEARDNLSRAVSEVNASLAIYRRHLSIRFHEATNRRIVTVYDSITNEAIREIPPERVLEAHASMLEMAGLFLDTRG